MQLDSGNGKASTFFGQLTGLRLVMTKIERATFYE
jgi:hypothetical protein